MSRSGSERQRYHDRIRGLADDAARARERFTTDPPDSPDDDRAMDVLREGFGPTVSLYCEARTGGTMVSFGEQEFDRLQHTMNTWLELYAACYGVELDARFTVREAAELLVETHNVKDVAQVLTDVPQRA